jgi:hypothetical protein
MYHHGMRLCEVARRFQFCFNLQPAGASYVEGDEPPSPRLRNTGAHSGAEIRDVKQFTFQAILALGTTTIESTSSVISNIAILSGGGEVYFDLMVNVFSGLIFEVGTVFDAATYLGPVWPIKDSPNIDQQLVVLVQQPETTDVTVFDAVNLFGPDVYTLYAFFCTSHLSSLAVKVVDLQPELDLFWQASPDANEVVGPILVLILIALTMLYLQSWYIIVVHSICSFVKIVPLFWAKTFGNIGSRLLGFFMLYQFIAHMFSGLSAVLHTGLMSHFIALRAIAHFLFVAGTCAAVFLFLSSSGSFSISMSSSAARLSLMVFFSYSVVSCSAVCNQYYDQLAECSGDPLLCPYVVYPAVNEVLNVRAAGSLWTQPELLQALPQAHY